MSNLLRRTFLKRLRNYAVAPAIMGGAGFGYGNTVERHRLTLEQHDLPLALGPKAPAKFRAVGLTDFHFDPLYEDDYVQRYISAANALKPDIVFLTGDYITRRVDRMDDLAVMLSKLEQKSGIFASTGNHDHWEDPMHVVGCLQKQGIEVLFNQHTRVRCAGGELVIAGLASACDGLPNWPTTAKGLKPDDRTITLMHEPDYVDQLTKLDPKRIALQLSGHTHGGQVCLPGIGAIHLPKFGRNYEAGFYDVEGIKLYVSRGLGTTNIHARLFCPPEITCFDITNTSVLG